MTPKQPPNDPQSNQWAPKGFSGTPPPQDKKTNEQKKTKKQTKKQTKKDKNKEAKKEINKEQRKK